jgi:TonB family protein
VDSTQKRLACLITSSVILHAVALAPLKANRSPSRLPFSPQLTVDLHARDAPLLALPVALATAPETAPVSPVSPPALPNAQVGAMPAAPNTESPNTREVVRSAPAPQPPGNPIAGGNEPSPNPAPQKKGGVRMALPDEVSVRVHLLSYEAGNAPMDTLDIQGKAYVYFKSPSLRQSAQPLDEPKPHYPESKPEYVHGAVMLRLLIDEAGNLEQAIVMCSNPTFEKSALTSIQHMRFTPALSVTGPVKSYMEVEFGYGRGYPCARVPD